MTGFDVRETMPEFVSVSLRMPPELLRELQEHATEGDRSLSAEIRRRLRRDLEREQSFVAGGAVRAPQGDPQPAPARPGPPETQAVDPHVDNEGHEIRS